MIDRFELGWRLINAISAIPGVLENIPESKRGNRDIPEEFHAGYNEPPKRILAAPSRKVNLNIDFERLTRQPKDYFGIVKHVDQ